MADPAMSVQVDGISSSLKFTVQTAGDGVVGVALTNSAGTFFAQFDPAQTADLESAIASIERVSKAAGELALP